VANLGEIYKFEITGVNKKVIPATLDLKHDQGYFYLGEPGSRASSKGLPGSDLTPILTMKMTEEAFQ
jgi:hypothetical protein